MMSIENKTTKGLGLRVDNDSVKMKKMNATSEKIQPIYTSDLNFILWASPKRSRHLHLL